MELEAYPGHPGEPRRRRLIRTSADQSASRLTAITPRKKSQAEIPRASPQGYVGVDLTAQGSEVEIEGGLTEYAPPKGELLLAVSPSGEALGCVAMHSMGNGDTEIKRLFVRPGARGMKVGRALIKGMVDVARALGYRRVVLDTLSNMTAAIATYESLGFERIPAYWANPLPVVYFCLLL